MLGLCPNLAAPPQAGASNALKLTTVPIASLAPGFCCLQPLFYLTNIFS